MTIALQEESPSRILPRSGALQRREELEGRREQRLDLASGYQFLTPSQKKLASDLYQNGTPEIQRRLFSNLNFERSAPQQFLSRIEDTSAFKGFSFKEQQMVLQLALVSGNFEDRRDLFGKALSMTDVKGRPLLLSSDCNGKSLLENLHRLGFSAGPTAIARVPNSSVSGNRGYFDVPLILQTIVDPGSIDQSTNPTCGVTCIEILLARARPSEYARITTDLILNGTAEFKDPSNGTRHSVNLEPTSASGNGGGTGAVHRAGVRSLDSAIFQDAFIRWGNDRYPDPMNPLRFDAVTGIPSTGTPVKAEVDLCAMLIKDYRARFLGVGKMIPVGGTFSFENGSEGQVRNAVERSTADGCGTLVDIRYMRDGKIRGHALVVESLRQVGGVDYVIIRDPNFSSKDLRQDGSQFERRYGDTTCRGVVYDRTQALVGLSLSDFSKIVYGVIGPR